MRCSFSIPSFIKMKTENTNRQIQWLPVLLIAWNLFDIFVHVRADLAEPLRISGNIVGIVAGLIVLFGVAKATAPQILGGAAAAVFVLNTFHSFQHGFGPPMLVFVGATLSMLLRLGQMQSSGSELYHHWWAALLISLVGVAIVAFAG